MNNRIEILLNCREIKCTPLNLLKDFYFLLMLMWPLIGLTMILEPGDLLIDGYMTFVYFGVLTFYWTPIFQKILDINSRSINILMYLLQWVPLFGSLGLIFVKLAQRDRGNTSSDKLRNVELKKKTEEKASSEELEDRKVKEKLKRRKSSEPSKENSSDPKDDFRDRIKNFHKRNGNDARIFEKIGRRMIITDDYEPKKVFRALDQAYKLRRKDRDRLDRDEYRDKREDLRKVAEESKEDDLDLTIRKLENLLEEDIDIGFEEETDSEDLEDDEKSETENQEALEEEERLEQKSTDDNYVDRINSFHNQGGYRYRLLERIGRRLLNQDSSPEEVYSLISEFSESNRFREMSLDELEQIATEANETNLSSIEDKLV
jgi:hypothetical protein